METLPELKLETLETDPTLEARIGSIHVSFKSKKGNPYTVLHSRYPKDTDAFGRPSTILTLITIMGHHKDLEDHRVADAIISQNLIYPTRSIQPGQTDASILSAFSLPESLNLRDIARLIRKYQEHFDEVKITGGLPPYHTRDCRSSRFLTRT